MGSSWRNRDAYFLRRETMWGLAQWKIPCCSSWTSIYRSQVGEFLGFHAAVSKRRVWTQSLKRAELRMTSRLEAGREYVFGPMYLDARRISDQSPFGRKSIGDKELERLLLCSLRWEFQNEVSCTTPSVSPWGRQQNGWDQWAHNSAAFVYKYTIGSEILTQNIHGRK